jgi:hypothetical protein
MRSLSPAGDRSRIFKTLSCKGIEEHTARLHLPMSLTNAVMRRTAQSSRHHNCRVWSKRDAMSRLAEPPRHPLGARTDAPRDHSLAKPSAPYAVMICEPQSAANVQRRGEKGPVTRLRLMHYPARFFRNGLVVANAPDSATRLRQPLRSRSNLARFFASRTPVILERPSRSVLFNSAHF